MNSVQIELFGTSFTIQTDEKPEYMQSLVARVERNARVVQSQTKSADPLKTAILVSIMLADELQSKPAPRPRGEPFSDDEEDFEEAARIAMRLISDIDERLPR